MTIKELQNLVKQKIAEEKKMASEATCKYSEGLHDGTALTLQGVLYYLTFVEVSDEESND